MVNSKVILGAVLTFFLLTTTALAQQEYNVTLGHDFTPFNIVYDYYSQYSPKIACEPTWTSCAALIFQDDAGLGRGLRLYYTNQNFEEQGGFPYYFPSTEVYTFPNSIYAYRSTAGGVASEGALDDTRDEGRGALPLGYDIWYDQTNQEYWIIYSSRSGQGDDTGSACQKYTYQFLFFLCYLFQKLARSF